VKMKPVGSDVVSLSDANLTQPSLMTSLCGPDGGFGCIGGIRHCGPRRAGSTGSFGFGQRFVDEISGDWGGKVMTDLDAVFDAVSKLPYVDPARQRIAGTSYGGYAVDWIIGHSGRFQAAVSHDGVFNLESMALATEELWFTDWEFGGPATSPKARENFEVVAASVRAEHENADARDHERAGLPRAGGPGASAVHRAAP